jgi:methylthioxylose transferase
VSHEQATAAHRDERRDLAGWLVLAGLGVLVTWLAVRGGARLGTAGAPFLGTYRLEIGPATALAPAVAAAVVVATVRGWWDRWTWPAVLVASGGAACAWALALTAVDGRAGFARASTDVTHVGDDPWEYLRSFTDQPGSHPPGSALALWAFDGVGLTDPLAVGLAVTVIGSLTVPLVLAAVHGVCGDRAGRRFVPVVVLAPYAVWLAAGTGALVAAIAAAAVAAGVRASDERRTGLRAAGWATVTGLLLGVAALFAYGVPWLGLSVACLYFARRRAALNLFTGAAALVPLGLAQAAGFSWVDGLMAARHDFGLRIEPHRSVLWWSGISLVVLLLAAGPALYASLRKAGNTPGWPFLVGAGAAVVFTVLAGLARGGVEAAWLAFFPWLTVAAVAPRRQGGPPVPAPLLLVGAGAAVAIAVAAVLVPAR